MIKTKKAKLGTALKIIAALLILSGLTLLLYPVVTDQIYQRQVHNQYEIFRSTYKAEESGNGNEENTSQKELYERLVKRNEELYETAQQDLSDPFSYEQPEIDISEYGLKDDIIGFVSIPKIDVYLPIYLGANYDTLSKGSAHLTNTSYPVGGNNTNCIIAGHRGWRDTAMFRGLYDLKLGDKIYIENFYEKLTYKVTEIKQILPYEVDELTIREGKDMVTLFTCAPFGYNTHRLLVRCERVQNNNDGIGQDSIDTVGTATVKLWTGSGYLRVSKFAITVTVTAAILIITLIILLIKRKKAKTDS